MWRSLAAGAVLAVPVAVTLGSTLRKDVDAIREHSRLSAVQAEVVPPFPFAGYQFAHKYPRFPRAGQIGLATWKKERLCALTSDDEGEFWFRRHEARALGGLADEALLGEAHIAVMRLAKKIGDDHFEIGSAMSFSTFPFHIVGIPCAARSPPSSVDTVSLICCRSNAVNLSKTSSSM